MIKRTAPRYLFLLTVCASLAWSSCTTFKEYDKETMKMRDPATEYVVFRNDGTKVTGASMKRVSGKRGAAFLLSGEEIPLQDAKAYQDKNAYHVKMSNNTWAKQLRRGKINLYYYDQQVMTGYRTGAGGSSMPQYRTDDHFCFSKGDGELPREMNRAEIAALLADNAEATAKFNSYWNPNQKNLPKSFALHRVIEVVDLYNR